MDDLPVADAEAHAEHARAVARGHRARRHEHVDLLLVDDVEEVAAAGELPARMAAGAELLQEAAVGLAHLHREDLLVRGLAVPLHVAGEGALEEVVDRVVGGVEEAAGGDEAAHALARRRRHLAGAVDHEHLLAVQRQLRQVFGVDDDVLDLRLLHHVLHVIGGAAHHDDLGLAQPLEIADVRGCRARRSAQTAAATARAASERIMRASSPWNARARRSIALRHRLQCGMAKLRHELRRKRDAIELALFTGAPVAGDEVRRALEVHGGRGRRRRGAPRRRAGLGRRGQARRAPTIATAGAWPACAASPRAGGATIYLMAVETFPDHVNNVYLVREGAARHALRLRLADRTCRARI